MSPDRAGRTATKRSFFLLVAGAFFGAALAAFLLPRLRPATGPSAGPADACTPDDDVRRMRPFDLGDGDTVVEVGFAGDTVVIAKRTSGRPTQERWLTDPQTGEARDVVSGRVALTADASRQLGWPAMLERMRRCSAADR